MAGGPILPSSMDLSGASGNLSATFYIPVTNTKGAGGFEGIGVIASLNTAADAPAVLQFNMPVTIPTGTLKLRCLAMANTASGVAKLTIKDGATSAGSTIESSTFTTETQLTTATWPGADILFENKITLTTAPTASQILSIVATFNATSWTLAASSVWQFTLVWE